MPGGSGSSFIYTPPSCNVPTGDYATYSGRYTHYGVKSPNYYYPGIEENPITLDNIGCAGGSASGSCPIVFGPEPSLGPGGGTLFSVDPFGGLYREKQNVSFNVLRRYYGTPTLPGIGGGGLGYSETYVGCVDKPYIMVVGGEFPPDLTINMETGQISGIMSEMDLFVEQFKLPPGLKFNESNYATVGSAGAYRNGLGTIVHASFVMRAFDPGYTGWYSDTVYTFRISNWWSSDRDRFILDITGPFAVDGVTTKDNLDYLTKMKQKGFWGN